MDLAPNSTKSMECLKGYSAKAGFVLTRGVGWKLTTFATHYTSYRFICFLSPFSLATHHSPRQTASPPLRVVRDAASACSSPDSAWFFVLCWSTQGKGRERAGGSWPAEPNRRSRGRIINLGTIWFVVSALIHARICVELIYHVKRINSTRGRRNRRISFWGKVCVLGRNLSFPEIGFKLSDDLLEITFHLRCDTVCKI
jgi:hypothetical protein